MVVLTKSAVLIGDDIIWKQVKSVMRKEFYQNYIKRFFDILLCSFALVVLSPFFLITAIAIKLSSSGPIFYYSMRLGKGKVPFRFYKFRSMHEAKGNDKGLCIADEERVFTVGKIIRRLKIDELPQLINVIKGDMSIVGPRPMVANGKDDFYSGPYESITTIRPGLTSAASLYDYMVGDAYEDEAKYRTEVVPIKLEMELYYVKHESLYYDICLIIRTIKTIILKLLSVKTFRDQPELALINRKPPES